MTKRMFMGGFLAAVLTGMAATAHAGDIANIQPVGFSADGKVFAFQEFGMKDGKVPYSDTYFIDTDTGADLEGTPFHLELTDKDANLSKARRQNLTAARQQMDKYDLLTNPGLIAAFNPPTELGSPMKTIRYTPLATDGPARGAYALLLGDAQVAAPDACKGMNNRAVGFTLQLIEKDGAPNRQLVHEDKAIPAERGCAVEYRMGGALVYQPESGKPVHIALVLALSASPDGRNGRWIAVPVHP
jgi:predicted secreted protein